MDARAEKNEPVLLDEMVRIPDDTGELVGKRRFGFLKRDAVLALVGRFLSRVPFKFQMAHELQCSYFVVGVNWQTGFGSPPNVTSAPDSPAKSPQPPAPR